MFALYVCGDSEKKYECFNTTNKCIDADPSGTNEVCDGVNNCDYFEDEMGCGPTCGIYQLTCANGNCVTTALDGNSEKRCDTFNDCGDYTDEMLCDSMIQLNPDTCEKKPYLNFFCPRSQKISGFDPPFMLTLD